MTITTALVVSLWLPWVIVGLIIIINERKQSNGLPQEEDCTKEVS